MLRVLTIGRARHGSAIAAALDKGTGVVYPALHRLLRHDWITCQVESAEHAAANNRPRRTYYYATTTGAEAFRTHDPDYAADTPAAVAAAMNRKENP